MKKFRKATSDDVLTASRGILQHVSPAQFDSYEDFREAATVKIYLPYLDTLIRRDYYDVTFWYTYETWEVAVGMTWDYDTPF